MLPLLTSRTDGYALRLASEQPAWMALPARDLYDLLWTYYLNNNLYDSLTLAFKQAGQWTETMKEFRNPAHRAVEFHTSKLWPGPLPRALPIATANKRLIAPIQAIWRWSNWGATKQRAARFFALFGAMFLKVSERLNFENDRRVFIQVIDPRYVSDFLLDERGYVIYIRMDIPQSERVKSGRRGDFITKRFTWTEIWDQKQVRIWKHENGVRVSSETLGTPTQSQNHGLSFVPVVYAPFRDIGDEDGRGLGCFTHTITKIDEANRMATRLHSLLFRHNDVTWAMESNMMDQAGRPLPPPSLSGEGVGDTGDNIVEFGGEKIIMLPGMAKLQPMVPQLNYGSALEILNAMLTELRYDLPELGYYEFQPTSNVSGTALRYTLAAAIDRVIEARGNGESALVRATNIALTIAQRAQLPGFSEQAIGTYESGAFTHAYAERPVIELSSLDRAQAVTAWVGAGVPLATALKRDGWQDDEVNDVNDTKEAERAKALELGLKTAEQEAQVTAKAKAEQDAAAAAATQAAQLEHDKELADHRANLDRQTAEHAAFLDVTKAKELATIPQRPAVNGSNGNGRAPRRRPE